MKLERRGFLKLLGATAATAVLAPEAPKIVTPASAAPLYVPSQRLDMGVPTQRLVLSTDIEASKRAIRPPFADAPTTGSIPMLLLHNEFLPKYGGKLAAGSTVLVDQETARRWVDYRVAVPGPGAPKDLQAGSARREAERARREDYRTQMYVDDAWRARLATKEAERALRARQNHGDIVRTIHERQPRGVQLDQSTLTAEEMV